MLYKLLNLFWKPNETTQEAAFKRRHESMTDQRETPVGAASLMALHKLRNLHHIWKPSHVYSLQSTVRALNIAYKRYVLNKAVCTENRYVDFFEI